MFRLVIKHQGKRYSFDRDSGAFEELAKQLKPVAGGASAEGSVAPIHLSPASAADASGDSPIRDVQGQAPPKTQSLKFSEGSRKGPPPPANPAPRRHYPPDGRFFWIEQRHLIFGADANTPRRSRPLMLLRDRRGPVLPVLPCTTGGPRQTTARFYRLDWDDWFRRVVSPSWLYRRSESVHRADLGDRLDGALPQVEIEQIGRWLRGEGAR
jgi:hypothetical protein